MESRSHDNWRAIQRFEECHDEKSTQEEVFEHVEPLWVPLDRRIEDNADKLHKARPGLERDCMSPLSIFAAWLCWWRNFKNTTIFAYGVTGAGKTHVSGSQPVTLCLPVDADVDINEKKTMQGTKEEPGLIPRAVKVCPNWASGYV